MEQEQLAALVSVGRDLRDSYALVLVTWERKGADADALKKHNDYVQAVQAATVKTSDPVTLLRELGRWSVSSDGGVKRCHTRASCRQDATQPGPSSSARSVDPCS